MSWVGEFQAKGHDISGLLFLVHDHGGMDEVGVGWVLSNNEN